MKKSVGLFAMIAVMVFTGINPALAGEDNAVAKSQVQVTIGHLFNMTDDLQVFAYGIYMHNLNNNYDLGFAYAGPVIKVGEVNVYVMGVVMAEPIGTSAGPSLWLELGDFFLEFDHYESWLAASHDEGAAPPPSSYYGLVDYGHTFDNAVRIGAMVEVVGYYQDDEPFELAYGPYAKFNKFKFWMAYDETPLVAGDDYWIFRLQFGI